MIDMTLLTLPAWFHMICHRWIVPVDGPGGRARGIDPETRHQLVVLARRPRARSSAPTRSRPTDWRPTTVRNPDGLVDAHFTASTAWELIAERLEAGHEVEVITLRLPPGAKGYVMKIDLGADVPTLYVKLQLGAGRIIGRSFHYSEY